MGKFKLKIFFLILPIFSILVACSKEAAEKADISLGIGTSIMVFLKALGLFVGWAAGIGLLIAFIIYSIMQG